MPPDLALPPPAALLAGTEPAVASDKDDAAALGALAARDTYLTRIAVRSRARSVIVPVHDIVRLAAEDHYVRIWADRASLHKETLTGLCARLDPHEFLRVHRSHAVNLRLVRELHPLLHGEFRIRLANGTEITSGRSYRQSIQRTFGLTRGTLD